MNKKTKTKCVRDFKCEVCGVPGMLQILTKTYARVRHYVRLDPNTKKPIFTYCRNSISYVNENLANLKANPDHAIDQKSGQSQINHDRKLNDNGSILEDESHYH